MDEGMPTAEWRRRFRESLLRWYRRHARELPWRSTRDPYAIWISETMLQQTQVETVKPYFERFLQRFPNVKALAQADELDVLRLWEGLGYYRRARQMHAAARVIVERHAGQFPMHIDDVRKLPGIGRYTAGAILSFAHDQSQPILEANTVRLHSRLLAYRDDPLKAAGQRQLWQFAEVILPSTGAGRVNQALMELGSLVCRPREPQCSECPVVRLCPTHAQGLQAQIPQAKVKVRYEEIREAALIVAHGGRILMRQCAPNERWAGMWDFPRMKFDTDDLTPELVIAQGKQQLGWSLTLDADSIDLRYGVTRYRIHLTAFKATLRRPPSALAESMRWVALEELTTLPLSVTGRKLARWVADVPSAPSDRQNLRSDAEQATRRGNRRTLPTQASTGSTARRGKARRPRS